MDCCYLYATLSYFDALLEPDCLLVTNNGDKIVGKMLSLFQ